MQTDADIVNCVDVESGLVEKTQYDIVVAELTRDHHERLTVLDNMQQV